MPVVNEGVSKGDQRKAGRWRRHRYEKQEREPQTEKGEDQWISIGPQSTEN